MKRPKTQAESMMKVVVVPADLQSFKAFLLRRMLPNLSISKGNLLTRTIDEYISLYCR